MSANHNGGRGPKIAISEAGQQEINQLFVAWKGSVFGSDFIIARFAAGDRKTSNH